MKRTREGRPDRSRQAFVGGRLTRTSDPVMLRRRMSTVQTASTPAFPDPYLPQVARGVPHAADRVTRAALIVAIVSLAVILAVIVAGLVLARARPASAAVWRALVFTAPADSIDGMPGEHPVARYHAQRSYDGTTWTEASLYRTIGDLTPPAPRAPGERETLLVSVSEADWTWRGGGTRLRLRAVDGAGNESNRWAYVVVAAGPDTQWTQAGGRAVRGSLSGPRPWLAGDPADTASASLALEHLEDTQRRVLGRLCAIYGYACRRGARDTAWCEEAQ